MARIIQKSRLLCSLVILTLLSLIFTIPASAAQTLTVYHSGSGYDGASVYVYRIADGAGNLTSDFVGAGLPDRYSQSEAAYYSGWVEDYNVSPYDRETVGNGSATFSLEDGIYLIVPQSYTSGNVTHTPSPFLYNTAMHGGTAYLKCSEDTGGGGEDPSTSITVRKDWVGDDSSTRPDEISVSLYRDGSLYRTGTLSAENGWRLSWVISDINHDWEVVENDVPNGYTSSVEQVRDTLFVITNTYTGGGAGPDGPSSEIPEEPSSEPSEPVSPSSPSEETSGPSSSTSEETEEPADPSLPQTGQLWWPVAVLLIGGAVLVAAGTFKHARGKGRDEQ